MVLIKETLISSLMAFLVLAAPGVLEARDPASASCKVTIDKGKTETYTFDYGYARDTLAKKAPAGTAKTASGYPHVYHNGDNLQWTTSNQQAACKSSKTTLLEFPILARQGTKPPPFKYTEKKDKAPPGPCRLIYTQNGGSFCGIMCHKEYNWVNPGTETDKGFIECE